MSRSRWLSFFGFGESNVPPVNPRGSRRRLQLEPLEDRHLMAVLTIAQENALPGTPASQWDIDGAGSDNIQGYAAQMSVNHGQTVQFKVDTDASDYKIDIYRIGYYQGNGARFITTINPNASLANNQPNPLVDYNTGLVDAGNWRVSASWNVPTDATSGVYIAKLTREDGTFGESHIIFVVRDDEGQSDMVFQTSDTTWQAYNDYGGASLYDSTIGPYGRALEVSYNRPFNTRSSMPINYFFGAEYAMVRFVESNGYDVSYISGIDTDRFGSELLEHKIFLSVGHDEYWSGDQRANVEAARDAGVNLAFFSGNEMFWKIRWEDSTDSSRTPYRTMVCYKETLSNARIDPTGEWTGTWRDPRFSPPADGGRPENAVTGTIFAVNGDGSLGTSITVSATDGLLRFWRNTSVASLTGSQTASLGNYVLGYEWDEDWDNGFRPAGIMRLSTTTVNVSAYIQDYGSTYAPGTATHHLMLYRADSGALVFGAGTVQWSWGLDDKNDLVSVTASKPMQQATVNLFADMGVQPTTLRSGLTYATMSTDYLAPTTTITSPQIGAVLQPGVSITIRGTATDNGGGRVAAVEVSTDGGNTWHPATGRESWTYTWTPRTGGETTIMARASDDSGNLEVPTGGVKINPVANPGIYSLFAANSPATADGGDGSSVEVGMRFTVDAAGYITGVRFYKSSANTGTHIANLWSNTGVKLATATFTSETGSGWQQVNFATPVAVEAGGVYVVSYFAPNGHYSVDRNYFATQGASNGPLHAVPTGAYGVNGVYVYSGSSAFPTQSFQNTNYWVDVVFNTTIAADTTPPTVTNFGVNNGTIANTNSSFTISFSEAVNPSTITSSTIQLVNPDDSSFPTGCCSTPGGWCSGCPLVNSVNTPVVPATVVYDQARQLAIITPKSPLGTSSIYTIVVKGGANGVKDLAGNALTDDRWNSFLTPGQAATPTYSLFADTTTPTTVDSGDTQSTELGVKFTANSNGYITGLRFYKGANNTGTHVGSLWSSSGQLLAQATFTSESASGWQTVTFSTPVQITAGTTYVASYRAPGGHYSVSRNYFGSAYTNGPLTAPAGAGVFAYGSGSVFPNQSYQNGNYMVDVLFSTSPPVDIVAPTVIGYTPAAGTTNVATSSSVTVTFSEAVDPATLTALNVRLLDSNNAAAPATLSYNATTRTVTLTPTSPLSNSMNYTIFVRGGSPGVKDLGGNYISQNSVSSFVTAAPPVPDTTAPTVIGFNPANGSSNIATTVAVSATFSEQINAATLASDNVVLLKNATNRVTTTLTYNSATNTVTLTPSSPLEYGASYTLFIVGGLNGVRDLSNNALVSNVTSAFTVANAPPPPPPDTTRPTVSSVSPAASASDVAINSSITIAFSEALNASTVNSTNVLLRNGAGATIAATVSYNSANKTVTLTPTAALANGTNYTVVIRGGTGGVSDVAGNTLLADVSSTFSTVALPPVSLFSTNTTPATADSGDTQSVELGVKFTATVNGYITGIRYYKSSGNTGTHVGNLWSSSGQLLASATFTNETASGWQTVTFSTPVAVTAGTSYVASYHTTVGRYSVNRNYFTSTTTTTGLSTATAAGVFAYGSGNVFPNQAYQNGNYWVDVLLSTTPPVDKTPPTVTAVSPSANQGNVATSASIVVTFSEALNAASVTSDDVQLLNASGQVVASTISYNATTRQATLTPTSTLATSTTYTVFVRGGASGILDTAGNALGQNFNSTFTTLTPPPPDTTRPTILSFTPASNATNVATSAAVTIVFSEAMNASTINSTNVQLRNAAGATISATVSYNSANNTATITPSAALANNTTYSIFVRGGDTGVSDLAGNRQFYDGISSFTTQAEVPLSLFATTTTPSTVDGGDTKSVELGVKFTADANGYVTAIRFYKAAANTGTHVGNLWSSSGQLLATATFTNETASGWQTVTFSTPVAITAGTIYVASYHTTSGHYSVNRNYFTAANNSGKLNTPAAAGVFAYGSGNVFPTNSYQNANYWVDVLVSSTPPVDNTPPTVTAVSPSANQGSVATNASVVVTFSEALNAASVTLDDVQLLNASNQVVAATVSYNAATRQVTLTPTSALSNSTTYTVFVRGGASGILDTAGNALAQNFTSTFTTLTPDTTRPTILAFTPGANATNVSVSSPVTIVFSEAMNASTINTTNVQLRNAAGTAVAATVTYNAANNTATLTPSAALASNTTYSIFVRGGTTGVSDVAGNNQFYDGISSFTTQTAVPVSLFSTTATPATVDSGDAQSVELGVKFTADSNGYITGIRFYKAAANTGVHVGNLWSSTGQLLATATFTNETSSGWQTVLFSTPVAVQAGVTYVASYHANSGHYSSNRNYFASANNSGVLNTPASAGVFRYGTGSIFPNQSYQNTNYWVDAIFQAS